MTVRELMEALSREAPDDQVVAFEGGEWTCTYGVMHIVANLGKTHERVVAITVGTLKVDSDDCPECQRLRDIIDNARGELDNA